MRERIAEIAARAAELAEINDAWILSRIKELAECSVANFLLFDADGKLVLDNRRRPIVDLSNATPEQLRTLTALEYDPNGRLKLKLRDPVRYLELLARNRGLLRQKLALTDASGEVPARVQVVSDRPMSDEEWRRGPDEASRGGSASRPSSPPPIVWAGITGANSRRGIFGA